MRGKGIRNKTRQLISWLLVFAFITATIFTNNITVQAAGKPSIHRIKCKGSNADCRKVQIIESKISKWIKKQIAIFIWMRVHESFTPESILLKISC